MGKFLQVDPMADKYASTTTYNYAFNNPVVMNDPSGADPDEDDDKDKEPQDYQPGVPDLGEMQRDANARADAMFDMMNGVANPLWNQMQYGSPFPKYGIGGQGQWVQVTTAIYNKLSIRGTDIVLGYEYSHDEISYEFELDHYALVGNSIGLVLNFTKDYDENYAKANGWDVITATDLGDALTKIQKYKTSGKKISNLVIHSHGTETGSQLHLGKSNLDHSYYYWKRLTNPTVTALNNVLAEVESGSTVVFTACNAGQLVGPAMAFNIRCDINAYMNMYETHGPDGSSGTSFYFGGVRIGGNVPNWTNIQSGGSGFVISIGASGISIN